MTTLPTWLVVVLGLAGPFVAVVAIIAAELSERSRRQLDKELKEAELDESRRKDLRTERRATYRVFSKTTKTIDPNEFKLFDLWETHSEIELLTDDPRVLRAASNLYLAARDARRAARDAWESGVRPAGKDPRVADAVRRMEEMRERFIDAARAELGLPPRPK